MEHSFERHNWIWHQLNLAETDKIFKITKKYHPCDDWVSSIKENKSNFLQMETIKHDKEYIRGSLVYQQHIERKEDYNLFHFYISKEFLITVNLDFSLLQSTNFSSMLEQMQEASSPAEGFFILLGEMLSNYLYKIDEFEIHLWELLWEIQKKNNIDLLEQIYKYRHELLIWKNLMIPMVEIKMGIEETFGEGAATKMEYKRTSKRIERGLALLREYQQEIDTLINLEEVVSTHRGNEIIKTLTVFTATFTPLMALGALWGMNFKDMPELQWKYGYPMAIVAILFSTLAVQLYLRMKGWMGDILKGKKKNSFFK